MKFTRILLSISSFLICSAAMASAPNVAKVSLDQNGDGENALTVYGTVARELFNEISSVNGEKDGYTQGKNISCRKQKSTTCYIGLEVNRKGAMTGEVKSNVSEEAKAN